MAETALVTGSAGFIGFHTSQRLLQAGARVIGLDAMTEYYDPALKEARHRILGQSPGFTPVIGRLEEPGLLAGLMAEHAPDVLVHLAAQAGVRYSIEAPRTYVEANLIGTYEVLEAARATPPKHLMLASTSSVYGANTEMPYAETHKADSQMSFYAATKKATEAMAHSYAHLYGLPVTMFRFFTVYGPWGRPDMALFKFVKAITAGEPIDVYNHGDMRRDFTFVDDLVEGLMRLRDAVPGSEPVGAADSLSPVAPFRVVNIGNGAPVQLMDFVRAVEAALGQEARINFMDMQPGDVPATWADATLLQTLVGALPKTPLEVGVRRFVEWYRDVYGEGVPD
ncbi:MAG: NAD-dependent epimerase/dehydratase family protein [Rhodobacter sp.]|nr:NAD-dependent epimerase/dehydratase family protein [Rhodobacter sp.]